MTTNPISEAGIPPSTVATGAAAPASSRPSAAGPQRSAERSGTGRSGGRPFDRSGNRAYRPASGRAGGRRFGRPKVCPLCVEKAKEVDYKDAAKLGRFISDRGRIDTRRRTGMCAKHQRMVSRAIKRARHLALLPYTAEHIHCTGGVGIVERPPRVRLPRREASATAPQTAQAPTPAAQTPMPTSEKEESAQANISAKEA
jgi:small subunit ribosomal protein S18